MIDQYKNETSQIHAPADLILKTKQAVREEEMRLEREKAQQGQNAHKQTVARQTKRDYGKTYKWALPVAAAILFAVLMNVSTLMIGNRFTKSQSDTASDTAAGGADAGGAEYELAAEAAEEESADMDAGMDKAFSDNGFSAESKAEAGEGAENFDMCEESADEAAAATAEDDSVQDSVNESMMDGDSGAGLSIMEVEEIPDFYEDKNTESIISHGLQFYVAGEQENKWKAYVSVDGVGYVITGDGEWITDQELFIEKAYELLAETVEGIE